MTTLAYSNSPPCVYQHFFSAPTPGFSASNRKLSLPPIAEDDVFDGTQYLEDLDSILHSVVTTDNEPKIVLEECFHYEKPRLPRDLTALMNESDRVHIVRGQRTPRVTLRQRMETYLSARSLQIVPEVYASNIDLDNQSMCAGENEMKVKDPDALVRKEGFMVWGIHPIHDNIGLDLLFKFTTDYGGCYVLKQKDALNFIQILKEYGKKYSYNEFYQVFTEDGRESLIVKQDGIISMMQDTISEFESRGQYQADAAAGTEERCPTHVDTTPKGPVQRFSRYLTRRRLKNLIRTQIGIALGRAKKSRGRLLLMPFRMLWKIITRQGNKP